MKRTKKLFSLALAFIMAMALMTPAFAASITIDPQLPSGTTDGAETYTAYKIFDATFDGDVLAENGNVSYTIDSTSAFFGTIQNFKVGNVSAFKLTQVNSTTTYIVEKVADYNAADLATELKKVITADVSGTTGSYNANGKYVISGLTKGYYIITSTLGSKMIVDTLSDIAINTKNQYPTLEKKIVTTAAAEGVAEVLTDTTTADYGAPITFKISVTIPETAVGEIVVHDTLDTDMTYVDMTAVDGISKQGATETVDEDKCSFEFVLSADYVARNKGTTVAIYYTAKLNANVLTATAHPNTAYLTYSGFTSTPDTVNVYTYKVDVYKYTGTDANKTGLAGAGFVLKNSEGKFYNNTNGIVSWVDSVNDATEYTTAADSYTVTFAGLANGTYTLIEKTIPAGYNPIQDTNFTVDGADRIGQAQIEVLNQSGTELPATGGMGTTIFYVVGGVLMAGAAILLITKKKMSNEQ